MNTKEPGRAGVPQTPPMVPVATVDPKSDMLVEHLHEVDSGLGHIIRPAKDDHLRMT